MTIVIQTTHIYANEGLETRSHGIFLSGLMGLLPVYDMVSYKENQ